MCGLKMLPVHHHIGDAAEMVCGQLWERRTYYCSNFPIRDADNWQFYVMDLMVAGLDNDGIVSVRVWISRYQREATATVVIAVV